MRPATIAPVVAALRGALLTALIASSAGAQTQTWIEQLGTSDFDFANGAAPDGAGGVFVTGVTTGSLGGPSAGGYDAWIAHHDATGNQTWIRQLGTSGYDFAGRVAPDGAGGVFVSGHTNGALGGPNTGQDPWLARYDAAGTQTWIRQFGSSNGGGYSRAATPDGAGGVYVSGYTHGSLGGPNAGNEDAWIARYDGAGSQTWIRQFGTSDPDWASASAPDGAGGVFVTGYTYSNQWGYDPWIARYDAAGNQTWILQFGTSHVTDMFAAGAAPDGAGGVYVAGWIQAYSFPTDDDAWIAHYDGAGNRTWILQLGTIGNDQVWGAAPDGSGGVYVSGRTEGSLGGPSAGGGDAWLAHYDATSNQAWIQQLGTSADDSAGNVAPDGTGGVFVTGRTQGSLGGPSAGGIDAWIARYSNGAPSYCQPAVPNSTGQPGRMNVTGSYVVADNDFTLVASQLSHDSFGYFITSRTQGFGAGAGGGQGNICLGGDIGRFVGPGQVLNSGAAGTFSLAIDLTLIPQPFVSVAASPGETWNFQAWFRDANPNVTSNFTDAVAVTFQ